MGADDNHAAPGLSYKCSRGAPNAAAAEIAGHSVDLEPLADHNCHDSRSPAENSDAQAESPDDESPRLRDLAAAARDLAADLRDREAVRQEETVAMIDDRHDYPTRALRSAIARMRSQAAADRSDAASDRQLAAEDRLSAGADRIQARVVVEQAHSDGLTGAQRRDFGRVTLQREIDRSRRSGEPFALAFIDVDGLKQLNDTEGHAAGDVLLQAVVTALKIGRRSYDPIVRLGGDEFLCGFTNTDLAASRRRIDEIRGSLERERAAASISVGLAILGERDTLERLIARADADMYSGKQGGIGLSDRRSV
jgi:diguanylate cyclase (GGDEF)-like protein